MIKKKRWNIILLIVCMLSLISRVQLFATSMDCSRPDSSVQGIPQARILEWVANSSSRGSSQIRDRTLISCVGRWILYHWATWKAPPYGEKALYPFTHESKRLRELEPRKKRMMSYTKPSMPVSPLAGMWRGDGEWTVPWPKVRSLGSQVALIHDLVILGYSQNDPASAQGV